MPDNSSTAYARHLDVTSDNADFNQVEFVARQVLNKAATTTLVQVKGVTTSGGLSPVGFVDVQPMVHQIDGLGKPTPHGTIYNLPYLRLQGGSDAIIIDPKVGDIGMASFASHDISGVKKNKAPSNPGSRRRFAWADGLYHGGMLNGVPNQFVRFHADGIAIGTPHKVTIDAMNIQLDASGNLAVTGEVTRGAGTVDPVTLGQHRHGVGASAAGTVVPTPGT